MTDAFKVDARKFNADLDKVAILLRKEAPVVVRDQARLLLVRAQVGFTPPKNKKAGVAAIASDLLGGNGTWGILSTIKDYMLPPKETPSAFRLWASAKTRRAYGVEKPHYQPKATVPQIRAWHKSNIKSGKRRIFLKDLRPRDDGRFVYLDRLMVDQNAFQRYMAFMAKRVGRLKSGWNKALLSVGGKIQSFAKRHDVEQEYGLVVNRLNKQDYPSITVGNQAPTITRWRKEWQTLLDTRARDMVKRAQFLLKKAKRKGGL